MKEFNIGDRIPKKDIKDKLKLIYDRVNIKQTAKAIDLEKWFEIKEVSIYLGENKKIHGFEILALKKNN